MIVIDSIEQEALDADPMAIQQSNFTWNLDWPGNTTMFPHTFLQRIHRFQVFAKLFRINYQLI